MVMVYATPLERPVIVTAVSPALASILPWSLPPIQYIRYPVTHHCRVLLFLQLRAFLQVTAWVHTEIRVTHHNDIIMPLFVKGQYSTES